MGKRLAASLMLVTIALLGDWNLLTRAYAPELAYFTRGPVTHHYFAAILLVTALLTVILALTWTAARTVLRRLWPGQAGRIGGALLLVVTFVVMWHGGARLAPNSPLDRATGVGVLAIVFAAHAWGLGVRRCAALVATVLAHGAVLCPVLIGFAIHAAAVAPSASAWQLESPRSIDEDSRVARRVVWLVFDEWDADISLLRRPEGVDMPTFDRLRGESLVSEHVDAPFDWTLDAMPAIWRGRSLGPIRVLGPGALGAEPAGSAVTPLEFPSDSVFEDLHRLGARIALGGWYHDPCGLFGALVVDCLSEAGVDARPPTRRVQFAEATGIAGTTGAMMRWHVRGLLPLLAQPGYASWAVPEDEELAWLGGEHARMLETLHAFAVRHAGNPDIDVVVAHYPLPHLPALRRRADRSEGWDADAYLANLEAMDGALADVLAALEDSGALESTVLVLSSDHVLRPGLWGMYPRPGTDLTDLIRDDSPRTVPLFVRLPGSEATGQQAGAVDVLVLRTLMVALVTGEIMTMNDLVGWLSAHQPSTYE